MAALIDDCFLFRRARREPLSLSLSLSVFYQLRGKVLRKVTRLWCWKQSHSMSIESKRKKRKTNTDYNDADSTAAANMLQFKCGDSEALVSVPVIFFLHWWRLVALSVGGLAWKGWGGAALSK